MKKVILSTLTLLSLLTLAACSPGNKKATTSESKAETTVETTEIFKIKPSTVTYPSDQELEAVQTVGQYKSAFKNIMDAYIKDYDGLVAQLPEEAKEANETQRDELVKAIEEQYKRLEDQFAALDANDDTVIPEESHETLINALKDDRDRLKSMIESIYQQAQELSNP